MEEEKFDIDVALAKYEEISYMYKNDYMTDATAQKEINELNEKCAQHDVQFKADFSSLIPHLKNESEDDSSSTDDTWDLDENSEGFDDE